MNRKKIGIGLAVLLVVLGVVWFTQRSRHPDDILRAEIEELYRSDTHGGTTPEETLQLFIQALEKGDVELASKYFEIENQGEMRSGLQEGLSNAGLDVFKSKFKNAFFETIKIDDKSAKINIIQDSIVTMTYDLYLNSYSNKWKLGKF